MEVKEQELEAQEEIEEVVEQDLKEEKTPSFDIRQNKMWGFYIDPKSETYGNAARSAIRAGYAGTTAYNITNARFFKIRVRRLGMLNRAEKVLKRTLIMDTRDPDTGKEQSELLRIQVDVAKHITKTLGKDEGYSERQEVTGKNGDQIVFMPAELLQKYSIPVSSEDITNKQE